MSLNPLHGVGGKSTARSYHQHVNTWVWPKRRLFLCYRCIREGNTLLDSQCLH